MEILSIVKPWDERWGTNARPQVDVLQPLRIGVHCSKGRHRAFAKVLLAAEGLRALGYRVYTVAPCTEACGCGSPGAWCTIAGRYIANTMRQERYFQLAQDAKLARDVACRSSAMTLAIIRRSGGWGEGRGAMIRRRAMRPCEEADGKG